MDKIKIITDSTVDIPKDILISKDVEVMPVLINFGEESYLDGVEIDLETMIERIERENVLPTTAQITPIRFEETFKKYLDDGYKVIYIGMSSGMSGTYQSACLAKNMLETDDVQVIDSQNITAGLGLLVLKAVDLKEKGLTLKEIVEKLEEVKVHIKTTLNFESLDNLVRGGRLSKTAAVVGSLLGIRIVLEIKDGKMSVKNKVRGSKKAIKEIINDIESNGVEEGGTVVLLTAMAPELNKTLKEYLESKNYKYIESKVGCAVGTHSGPKAGGLFYIEKY